MHSLTCNNDRQIRAPMPEKQTKYIEALCGIRSSYELSVPCRLLDSQPTVTELSSRCRSNLEQSSAARHIRAFTSRRYKFLKYISFNFFFIGRMSVLFIGLFVLALVVLFYYVIVLYIQFVLELNSINK